MVFIMLMDGPLTVGEERTMVPALWFAYVATLRWSKFCRINRKCVGWKVFLIGFVEVAWYMGGMYSRHMHRTVH